MLIPTDGRLSTRCRSSVFDKAVVQTELIGSRRLRR